ncbi:non-ribosomal peptide synthetase [Microcoleus sp. FACHB-672]|uniref:non-ribosomal peptide synthetase n=1 Tax=Microcoleus sp. FACHB-672 TaxID=2692825 RepID=UPI00168356FA|nr:non-ribosomal peptide synthetase [Microcoleus sp. FACHB-672]MBD2043497.1 amino acid adenylation domain-containing protein [Microcoleus sp. FACHB-672]
MNIVEFLSELRSLDIQVFVDGDRLRCNAPEGTLTPEIRAQLAERKAEIISFLRQANININATSISPVSRADDKNFPLSFAQQRLWFLDQLVPGSAFYNVPTAFRLTGTLNLTALEQTFNEIVRRHEALRTTFQLVDGQPVQKISPSLILSIPVINLREVPAQKRETEARRVATEEAHCPFDLTNGPLLRVKLLQFGETEHVLLLNLHHIVSDGWSIGVLIREVGALYAAFVTGKPSPLPALPIQYADFALWQREWLPGKVLETQLAYWQKQLSDISILNLSASRPRPAIQTYRGATQTLSLPKPLSEALEALSQEEGATLFMTLLAAFQTLLYRYTGAEDIAVGSPIANRNRSDIEPLIGFFVNSLVLRADFSGNPTFQELLSRVREVALGAYAHQDLPFEKLVEELHPERNLNQNPLFQVVFALQNAPVEALELPGLILRPQQFDSGTTRFDLEFHLWQQSAGNDLWVDRSDGISGLVVYSTDLFDHATIERMLGHFQTLLEGIVGNPEQPISDLPILSESELDQLLVEWNNTEANYPKKLCVHQLFEAQVERTPDAIALVLEDKKYTYRQLNTLSNQLAHYLKKQGFEAEDLIGICVERSIEIIVGMLGILKAGAAYLPLDPTYPSERLNFILKDAQVPIVLTASDWVEKEKFASIDLSCIICLDQDWEKIAQESEDNPISSVTAGNLAYVIYTSGSTGKPKGVQIQHSGLLNLVFWHQQAFSVSPLDRVTQIAGVAFDACVWEIWPYLTAGASIYFPEDETRLSPEKLRDWLVLKAITISFLPTPLAEKVLQIEWPKDAQLRLLLTGGDKLHEYPLNSYPFQVVNNYGPAENTVVTTSGQITIENQADLGPPIGRPIANTKVYVLDSNLQPAAIGISGELYISGDGLARGYFNRPDLTAERFIPNPFSDKPGSRLYKTGDLVRYRGDGNLEFLGRSDDQIKIRGFRIELGEIESVLNQHPAVLQTVAVEREDAAGEKRLVAYLTLNAEGKEQPESIEPVQLQDEQVLQWQMLYDETYQQPAAEADPTFNIIGWNSSYTDQPIPAEHVREWVNNQVAQILALQPKRVLEIGCGTGLVLFRVAPHCTQYCGTDFSAPALHYIQQQVAKQEMPQVTLLQKIATDFNGIEAETFDTVILNSVVQYFPNIDYLAQVLKGAVQATAPGGFIFIGDVRSLPLLEAFHASVQLYQAEPSLTREQLQQRVQMQVFQETELVIDPGFFTALKEHLPEISDIEIQLMRGRHHNELTQFRYNVILHIKTEKATVNKTRDEVKCLDWIEDNLTLSKIHQLLTATKPEAISITRIPNARVMAAVKTAEWLSEGGKLKTASQLQRALQEFQEFGVEPEDLYGMSEKLSYVLNISWSEAGGNDCYDAIFVRKEVLNNQRTSLSFQGRTNNADLMVKKGNLHSYANNPLQAKAARKLVPQLQSYLTEKLPEYMVPSAFVVLESLPITPNGKVDRRALPAPEPIKPELSGSYVAPRTPVEERLVKIWAEILGLKRLGIHDNFFELGGHSLLATQLISRVRDAFEIELPLRSVFEAPTITEFSKLIENFQNNHVINKAPALVPISRESRRMKLSSLSKEVEDKSN